MRMKGGREEGREEGLIWKEKKGRGGDERETD